jgi:hypothetical protein
MPRKALGSDLSHEKQQALLDAPLVGVPQPHKSESKQAYKRTSKQAEPWHTKTIRLPVSTIHELERLSGERKPDRQYPWKVQDIVHEALSEYFTKQGKGHKRAA